MINPVQIFVQISKIEQIFKKNKTLEIVEISRVLVVGSTRFELVASTM